MPLYIVTITETSTHEVEVEADSESEAESRALQKHIDGDSSFVAVTDRTTSSREP